MKAGKRNIASGREYDYLFPKAAGTDQLIKRNADLDDTLKVLPKIIQSCSHQLHSFASFIGGKNRQETCDKIWTFLYHHLQYEPDEKGYEQIRSPQRSWQDRVRGVDCDDYSVFIACTLENLGIPYLLRVTKYHSQKGFQHIYVVAKDEQGKEIIMDAVVDRFNREVPYIEKKDKTMELQFLNGLPASDLEGANNSIDAEDLLGGEDWNELGKIKLKKPVFIKKAAAGIKKGIVNTKAGIKQAAIKTKAIVKKGVHAINRVNPAAALLRAGLLASLKLNLMRVSENLRYTYLSSAEAMKRGFDMAKWNKLMGVRQRLEKIFYGAGGKPENLRSAILTGKGNKNKEVPLSGWEDSGGVLNEEAGLAELLGIATYQEELEGVEGLGEPATATAIAAASGAMSALALLIKNIGALRKNKDNQEASNTSENTPEQATDDSAVPANDSFIKPDLSTEAESSPEETAPFGVKYTGTPSNVVKEDKVKTGASQLNPDSANQDEATDRGNQSQAMTKEGTTTGWMGWVKSNKLLAIGAGALITGAVVYGIYKAVSKSKSKTNTSLQGTGAGKVKGRWRKKSKKGGQKIKLLKLK